MRIPHKLTLVLVITLACLLGWAARPTRTTRAAAPAVFANIVVNNTGTAIAGGDGLCTLPEAITNANNNTQQAGAIAGDCAAGAAGLDNITFSLGAGPYTITGAMPAITEAVNLNGSTGNLAFPRVQLISPPPAALTITSSGSTIRSLVISSATPNSGDGIRINDTDGPAGPLTANGNTIQDCYIGLDPTGTLDNGFLNGIRIFNGATDNLIGGTTPGARNVISGHADDGIEIEDAPLPGNRIQGNYIGTNAAGTAGIANRFGIYLPDSPGTLIGGTTAGARNVIGATTVDAILSSRSPGITIQGNFIGTDATGLVALGTGDDGIDLNGDNNAIVGGTVGTSPNVCTGACNLVAASGDAGIEIFQSISGAVVQGNFVGVNVNGVVTAGFGNAGEGVDFTTGTVDNNLLGGTNPGEGNLIAGNPSEGVRVGAGATGNAILGNRIFSNGALGIDLTGGGVTANDPQDPDTGANNLQNFPVINCVVSGSASFIGGTLNSLPNSTFRIEFFANAACDPSGNGEGQRYLGFQNVTTDGSGNATIAAAVPASVAAGEFVTSTATLLDATMNNPTDTSEFSACFAGPFFFPTVSINDVSLVEGNAGMTNAVFTVTVTGVQGACGPVTVNYATQDGTATGPSDFTPTSGALIFNPPFATNTVTQQITVPVVGEFIFEPNETFFVNIAPIGATATDAQGQGTIINDDSRPPGLTVSIADPFGCTGPGDALTVTAQITNPNTSAQTVNFTATLPAGLVGVPGTGTSTVGTPPTVTATSATFTATLAAGQTATLTYQVQVGDISTGTALCINSTARFLTSVPTSVQACATINCPAVGPGSPFPSTSEVSDQKAGSVLIYNYYTSDVASPATNTRISITNTNPTLPIAVHLFFVDGATCSVADAILCLTQNQTVSLLASDYDPGTSGYVVAVASDLRTGCPVNFNFLIGDEFVKTAAGFQANLGAEAIAALAGGLPACDDTTNAAVLNFDGVQFNRLPRVLAADNIADNASGNATQLVINRIGGNLLTGADRLGTLFGVLYDDIETPYSFQIPGGLCQVRGTISGTFPRTVPRVEQIIPAGRSGWLKLYDNSGGAILGAQLVNNANVGATPNAFRGGHNLHKLTLAPTASLTIPIFPPNCRL